MRKYRVVCDLNFGHILVQTVLWIIVSVITFGLALPFFAYYFIKIILNHTELHEIA